MGPWEKSMLAVVAKTEAKFSNAKVFKELQNIEFLDVFVIFILIFI